MTSSVSMPAPTSTTIRDDVAANEVAAYCLHALTAASGQPSRAAVRRLVAVTLDGLRTARPSDHWRP